nr:MAG TPA: hypothetical protein [Caudoviricetes sp.]
MANIKHNTEKTNTKIKYILNQSLAMFFCICISVSY